MFDVFRFLSLFRLSLFHFSSLFLLSYVSNFIFSSHSFSTANCQLLTANYKLPARRQAKLSSYKLMFSCHTFLVGIKVGERNTGATRNTQRCMLGERRAHPRATKHELRQITQL